MNETILEEEEGVFVPPSINEKQKLRKQFDYVLEFIGDGRIISFMLFLSIGIFLDFYCGHTYYQMPIYAICFLFCILQLILAVLSFHSVFSQNVMSIYTYVYRIIFVFIRVFSLLATCFFSSLVFWVLWNSIYPAIILHYYITLIFYRFSIDFDASPPWFISLPIMLSFMLYNLDDENGISFRSLIHLSLLFLNFCRYVFSLFEIELEGYVGIFFLLFFLYIRSLIIKEQRANRRPIYVRSPLPSSVHTFSSSSTYPIHQYSSSLRNTPSTVLSSPEKIRKPCRVSTQEVNQEQAQLRNTLVNQEFSDQATDEEWSPNNEGISSSKENDDNASEKRGTKRKRLDVLESSSKGLCKICWEEHACVLLEPCLHLCMCDTCVAIYDAHREDDPNTNCYSVCPICRTRIQIFKHIFLD